jgi:hypothetical protein
MSPVLERYSVIRRAELQLRHQAPLKSLPTELACLVCGPPLETLLTSGVHAGVAVMAAVAFAVIVGLVRGAVRLLREDRDSLAAESEGDMR